MEILRFYAQTWVEFRGNFAHSMDVLSQRDIWADHEHRRMLSLRLRQLRNMCVDSELHVTRLSVEEILRSFDIVENPQTPISEKQFIQNHADNALLIHQLHALSNTLSFELSTKLFFQLPSSKAEYFDAPRKGWEPVVERFPDCQTNVEEMNRCFALSRYAAAVFHSLLVVETGLIDLGKAIGAQDPKAGWDATYKRLKTLIEAGNAKFPIDLPITFSVTEQIHQCVQSMKSAWRNKVNHAAGQLAVLKPEFTPDIAEEIMMATRAFMRQLATELPNKADGASA